MALGRVADPLPHKWTAQIRIDEILDATPLDTYPAGDWHLSKGSIIPDDMHNRILALKTIGITREHDVVRDCHVYLENEKTLWADNSRQPDKILAVGMQALKLLEAMPTDDVLKAERWREAFSLLPVSKLLDPIYDETMARIERGRTKLKGYDEAKQARARPENLLIMGFGLWNLPEGPERSYVELLGATMLRDYVAMTIRAWRGAPPLSPQLLYILLGDPGEGKSTFCIVLAGGKPSDATWPRHSNTPDFHMVDGNYYGQKALADAGLSKTVWEFADKATGEAGQKLGGQLKNMANCGSLTWRLPFDPRTRTANVRAVKIITANLEELTNDNIDNRRPAIFDLPALQKLAGISSVTSLKERHKADEALSDQEQVRLRKNPWLDELADDIDVMLAVAFDRGDWEGTLAAPAELAVGMIPVQNAHRTVENWEARLAEQLAEVIAFAKQIYTGKDPMKLVILSAALDNWAHNQYARAPSPNAMGRCVTKAGWGSGSKKIGDRNQKVRTWRCEAKDANLVLTYVEGGWRGPDTARGRQC